MWKKIKPYAISVAIALAAGGVSFLITRENMDLYSEIKTPPSAPPGIVFSVVWTILYVLMGISSAIIYTKGVMKKLSVYKALKTYAVQLLVNFLWSILFFNIEAFFISFLWIICLWLLIIRMISRFYKIDSVAAYLQIPYFLWVTFAAYLNFSIYLLN